MEKINGWTGSLGRIELPSGKLTKVEKHGLCRGFYRRSASRFALILG